jgi:hypothetical protein
VAVTRNKENNISVCSICEKKNSNWICDESKENIFLSTKCPLNKWDKAIFPSDEKAKEELLQLNHKVLDEQGRVKVENLDAVPLPADTKKQKLSLRPHKNLLNPQSSIQDIIYCAKNYPPGGWLPDFYKWENTQEAFRTILGETAIQVKEYPSERFNGRGIVICGGGPKYFPSLYVNTRIIRLLGCKLPIKICYLGDKEMDPRMISILETIGPDIECVDATLWEKDYPIRIHAGWETKVYSIINCSFQEVLMLDADNTPLVDPTYLFDDERYKEKGAILWSDYPSWKHDNNMWKILGILPREELQVESGQVLVNKSKSWKELQIAKYFCDYSDYYFKLFYGDKEAFHFGWRFWGSDYAFSPQPDWINNSIILQKDLNGSWLFSHRAQAKFKLNKTHKVTMSMPYEQDTLDLLDELSEIWSGHCWINKQPTGYEKQIMKDLSNKRFSYLRVGLGEPREITFSENGKILLGADRMERHYHIFTYNDKIYMSIHGDSELTMLLEWNREAQSWLGKWLNYEKCPVIIKEI